MGRTYLFECPKCNYRAYVAGGVSEGAWFAVQTIVCADCREVLDAVVQMKFPVPDLIEPLQKTRGRKRKLQLPRLDTPATAPSFQAALNRLPPEGAKSYRWVKFKLTCPVSPKHRIEPWVSPGKCPKCGLFMDGNALPFRVWD
ncbi:MAG: hypothetical protein EPO07_09950 [Verrucomicrobia bacterium]|nr:MAG: hypothetical protein EPO07_09950 [Verrucomicrobiota bacterium]